MNNYLPMYLVPAFQIIWHVESLSSKSVLGVEFLARWVSNGQPASPADIRFVDWKQVDLDMISTLHSAFDFNNAIFDRMFINVSNETFSCDTAFEAWLSQLVSLKEHSGKLIVIEITEGITPKILYSRWKSLEEKGFQMALDDFGAYYSTLGRLSAYDWAFCKFDEPLRFSSDMVKAAEYCQKNGICMIAERVESKEMLIIARARGMLNQQGYYHHEPELMSFAVTTGVKYDHA